MKKLMNVKADLVAKFYVGDKTPTMEDRAIQNLDHGTELETGSEWGCFVVDHM